MLIPSDIGFATAKMFASEKIKGMVISSTEQTHDLAVQRAKELSEYGTDVVVVSGDISKKSTAKRIVDAAKNEFGQMDILVHNAGLLADGPTTALKEESLDRVMGVNAKGALFLAQESFPLIRRGREEQGSIVIVASPAGIYGSRGQAAYIMSKAAEIGLAKALVFDFAGRNIRVNVVLPGLTKTDMGKVDPRAEQMMQDATPLRMLPTVEQSARTILFFASPMSDGINNQMIEVGGGLDGGLIAIPGLMEEGYIKKPKEK